MQRVQGLLLTVVALLTGAPAAQAATFDVADGVGTVDGGCIDGDCSLIDAITSANAAPGADSITFSIGLADTATANAPGPMPSITAMPRPKSG